MPTSLRAVAARVLLVDPICGFCSSMITSDAPGVFGVIMLFRPVRGGPALRPSGCPPSEAFDGRLDRRSLRPRGGESVRRVLTALVCTLVLAACGGSPQPVAEPSAPPAPSPSDDGRVTLEDARAALESSPAAQWATGNDGLGPKPKMPAGFSAQTGDYAYEYATTWLGFAQSFDSTWEGRTDTWADIVDPDDEIGVREDLTSGRAFLYVNAFVRSTRVVEEPRIRGAFTTEVGEVKGEKTLRLTWKGTAVYLLENVDGSASLLPVSRQVTWSWFDGGSYPGVSTYASFGNVDICVISGIGLIKPTAGDIVIEDKYFAPDPVTKQTEQEQAEQQARIDAC